MQIDVLYFDQCPNHLPVERINTIPREEGSAEVREVLEPMQRPLNK